MFNSGGQTLTHNQNIQIVVLKPYRNLDNIYFFCRDEKTMVFLGH